MPDRHQPDQDQLDQAGATSDASDQPGTVRSGQDPSGPPRGAGRVLIAVYGLFAIAATTRAGVQLGTRFDEAPLAYLLSALAGVIYILATVSLALGGRVWRGLAWIAISTELVGVLAVGTASVVDPEAFPRATVWSTYGIGYGFIPLVLPFLGLFWMLSTRGQRSSTD